MTGENLGSRNRYQRAAFLTAALLLMAVIFTGCGKAAAENAAVGNSSAADAAGTGPGETGGETRAAVSLGEQLRLAWNFLTEGNYQEAVLAFTAIIDIDPKSGDAYRGRAGAYMGLAGEAASGSSAEDYADYLRLAKADYSQAALYLPEQTNEQFNAQP